MVKSVYSAVRTGRIILRWIFIEKDFGVMDWIEPAQGKDFWRVLVNVVINLRVL
jgi:hypothetical protein